VVARGTLRLRSKLARRRERGSHRLRQVTIEERFFPASPDETFAALQSSAESARRRGRKLYRVRNVDSFSRTLTYDITAGWAVARKAAATAQVVPRGDGCVVRVNATHALSEFAVPSAAPREESRRMTALLDAVGEEIQADRQRHTGP
jgi:hypothetical protein